MYTLDDYYNNQAGSGLGGYAGVIRFQRGRGPVGAFLKRFMTPLIPLLKNIGGTFLDNTVSAVNDLRARDSFNLDDMKKTFRDKGEQALFSAADQVISHAKRRISSKQAGSGRPRGRPPKGIKVSKTVKRKRMTKKKKKPGPKPKALNKGTKSASKKTTRRKQKKVVDLPDYLKY